MRPFTSDDLRSLLGVGDAPCVSIYIKTARGPAAAAANALAFKNAMKDVEAKLAAYPKEASAAVLSACAAVDSPAYWNDQRDSFALFASPTFTKRFRLGEPTSSRVVVGDSFHTKPMVKYLQGEVRYYLLTIAKENVTLWEGGRATLDPIAVPGMPRGLRELEEGRGKDVATGIVRNVGPGRSVHGGGEVDGKQEIRALFRAVDRALLSYTHDEKAPLLLATYDHYHALFHEVSKNPALLDEGIAGDPASMTPDELRTKALEILKPLRRAALEKLRDAYPVALNAHKATNYLPNIAKAAVYGRVKTLMLEDGRVELGRVDRETGEVEKGDFGGADLLDDVGELVLRAGGDVFVLPKELMPTDVGVAAIYRY